MAINLFSLTNYSYYNTTYLKMVKIVFFRTTTNLGNILMNFELIISIKTLLMFTSRNK